ncbi:TonB-dependent receptor [Pseudoalteromonas ulvae]|uniref:TonB-dependent receptor n=1 Tax=Pseudoalteromonas ulvae TaxID=107327 RepID=UPI00186B7B35
MTLRRAYLFVVIALTPTAMMADELADIERITTTATRSSTANTPRPFVISTVSQTALKLVAPTHIEQVLKHVAGANIQHGNGQEYLPALRSPVLSGAGACGGILTAEDGIALRAAGFCNINELFEAHTEMAERIEVLKGPGSALYGSNAVHGVINVITPDSTQARGFASLDLGSFGYKRAKFQQGHDMGDSGIGISASVTRDSGYRDDESVAQEKVSLRYRLETDNVSVVSGLTFSDLDQHTAGFIEGFESYKDPIIAQSNAYTDAFRKATALRAWSQFTWQNERSTLVITPYLRDQDMRFFKHFLPGTPLEENGQTGGGVQSLWHYQGFDSVQVELGFDGEYTQANMLQYQQNPTQGSAFLVATVPQGKHYDYDVASTLYAPFFNLQWQWQALRIDAGARYEHLNYDYDNNMAAGRNRDDGTPCGMGGCRYSRPPSSENSFSTWSPKFGLNWALSGQHLIYANVSQGYRAPQAAELYQLQRNQTVAGLAVETANNLELGIKGVFNDGENPLNYVFSVYGMDKDNVIFRDSDFFTINDGKSSHRGVELELEYAFNADWQLRFAGTHAKHRYESEQQLGDVNIKGNEMDTAPRNIANVQLNWQPRDTIMTSVEWHHVGRYFTDAENLHEYEGHQLVNVRANWQPTEQLSLTLRINNLANTAYADRADYTSFSGDRYFPGKPRHLAMTLQYNW